MKPLKAFFLFLLAVFLTTGTFGQSIELYTSYHDIFACQGSVSQSPAVLRLNLSGNNLRSGIMLSASPGFEISRNLKTAYSGSLTVEAIGGTVNETILYVRSSADAPAGMIAGTVTASSARAETKIVKLTAAIRGIIPSIPDQIVVNGAPTKAVDLAGNNYYWVNDNPGVGLPASGFGPIPSFAAVNNGSIPATASIKAIPFSSGQAFVTGAVSNTFALINLATNKTTFLVGLGNEPIDVLFSPDGEILYYLNANSPVLNLKVAASFARPTRIPLPGQPTRMVSNADGSRVYLLSHNSNAVYVVNTLTRTLIATVPVGAGPTYMALSTDGATLFVSNEDGNSVSMINTAENVVYGTLTDGAGRKPNALVCSPDGKRLYVGFSRGINIVDIATGTLISSILTPTVSGLSVSPDGSRIYASIFALDRVEIYDTKDYSLVKRVKVGSYPNGSRVSADGNWLYVVNTSSGDVSVINTITNELVSSTGAGVWSSAHGNFILGGLTCNTGIVNFKITVNPSGAGSLVISGDPIALHTRRGTPSEATSVSVLASGISTDVTVSAPIGFELSRDNIAFSDKLTLPAGDLTGPVTIYIRLRADNAAGIFKGEVSAVSDGGASSSLSIPDGTVDELPVITVSALSGSILSCQGSASLSPSLLHFTLGSENLFAPLSLKAPPGFELSGDPVSGFGKTMLLTHQNGPIRDADIYVRSAADAPGGEIIGEVLIESAGAETRRVAVRATVMAMPRLDRIADIEVVEGRPTSAIIFGGSYGRVVWTNDRPDIGLAASGTGDIASFFPLNSGQLPVTATLRAVPLTTTGAGCEGDAVVFRLTVNPAAPSLTLEGNIPVLGTVYGTPSAAAVFSLSGKRLSSAVRLVAPEGYEISEDNTAFTRELDVAVGPEGKSVLYIRLGASADVGDYQGQISGVSPEAGAASLAGLIGHVLPAPLILTAVAVQKVYGQSLPSSLSTKNFTATGLKNGDRIETVELDITTGLRPKDPVGKYSKAAVPVSVQGSLVAGNYAMDFIPGDVDVEKAKLRIKAEDKVRGYGQVNPEFTLLYSGFVNQEGPVDLMGMPVAGTNAGPASVPGDYVISVSGGSSLNYEIDYVQGILTVIPGSIAFEAPTAFSPNGDGVNDQWNIKNIGLYPNCRVEVFNRGGNRVFSSVGYQTPWDGTYNGSDLPVGTYFYTIRTGNGTKATSGWVVIIR
ncbi:MAG: gliding motility-associated C-terminal domain-containing protein [Sphingobacteriaceae bacterium]|nr:gliding motility-associated C-terminal domain-containing protein [Sphingobacteriaceae bacterium]